MRGKCICLYLGLAFCIPLQVYGANPIENQEQLNKARQQQELRETRLGEQRLTYTDVESSKDGSIMRPTLGPAVVSPSFYISQIRIADTSPETVTSDITHNSALPTASNQLFGIDNSSPLSTRLIRGPLAHQSDGQSIVLDVPSEFSFLSKDVKKYVHRKLSIEDVNTLSSKLNESLISRGYVTSKISIPPQSLATGLLQFNLQLGRIENVRYAEGTPHLPWENAFPLREGDVLNIRDIEQGLEQMRRLGSQSATVELEPGSKPLYSNIILNTVLINLNCYSSI